MTTLRARLEAAAAGELQPRRGNTLTHTQVESVQPFANACGALARAAYVHVTRNPSPERIAAPSALLPPLI